MAAPLILLGALSTGIWAYQNKEEIDGTKKEKYQLVQDTQCKADDIQFKPGDTVYLNNKADKKALVPIPVDDTRTTGQVLRNEYIPLTRKDTRPNYIDAGFSITQRSMQNMYRNGARRADIPNLQFLAEKKETQNNLRRVRERQMVYSTNSKKLKRRNAQTGQGLEGFEQPQSEFDPFRTPKINDFEDNMQKQRTFNSDVPLGATTITQRQTNNYVTTGLFRETPRVPVTQRGLQEEWMGLGTLDPDPIHGAKVLSLSKAARRSKGASGGVQQPWASLRDKTTSREQLEFETFGGPKRKIIPKYFLNQSSLSRVVGEQNQIISRRSKQFEYYRAPNFRIGRQSAIVTTGMIETNRNGADSAGFYDGKGGEVEKSNTRMPILNRLSAMRGTLTKNAVAAQGEIIEFPQRGGAREGMGNQVAPKRPHNGVSKLDRFGSDTHRFRRECNVEEEKRLYIKAVAKDNIQKNPKVWFRQETIDSENKGIGLVQPINKLDRTQM